MPVTVVVLPDVVRGEYAENALRKSCLPSEIDAFRCPMAPAVKGEAKKRQGERTVLSGTFVRVSRKSPDRSADKIGAIAGVSGRTVEKIAAVMNAADAEPERFGSLVEEMGRIGKVDRAYRKVRQAQTEQAAVASSPEKMALRRSSTHSESLMGYRAAASAMSVLARRFRQTQTMPQ
ncbi:MAG: hypothetical protein R3F55_09420 [Alphaproteobacteria bacterium]